MKSKYNPLSSSLLGLSRLLVGGFCAGALAFAPCAWADTATYNTPGTVIWTVPANVNAVTIECRGGGGAGGAAVSETIDPTSNYNIRGGGGAGGNCAKKVNLVVSEGEQYEVTVGAGGISPAAGVFVQGGQLPEQTGGSSSFKKVGDPVAAALATGGLGGKNGVRLAPTNSGPNQGGGAPSLANTCIGGTIVLGGSGGGASSSGTGAGGGGAGDTSVGGTGGSGSSGTGLGGSAGISGGGLGAASALNLSFPGGDGTAGAAPGGGGSGSARNTAPAIFKIPGGAGGAGRVLLTWTVNAGTTQYVVESAASSFPVGAIFEVTVTAKDGSNNTVVGDANVITMSSPTSGSLMEFDWDANGTFGDNSGTLLSGVRVIQARNKKAQTVDIIASAGPVTTPDPLSITTTLGAFSMLQLIAPGETAAPGTATGKTGTPTGYGVGTAFNVTVNAVDEFWNFINTVTDTVAITSTDSIASLPANAPLAAGTVSLPVTLNTPGSQTLTASDVTNPLILSNTSPTITVFAIGRTWDATVDNLWDTTTANWLDNASLPLLVPALFANLNAVTFSSNVVTSFVDLNGGTVAPFSILANATSASYEFSNGSITGTAGGLTKAQNGILILDTNNSYTGPTTVNGGLLRLKSANALPTASALTLNTGILGLENGNFIRALGTAANQVILTAANGGFAAFNLDRIVNLGGIGAPLTWGVGGFFNAGGNLTLGHATATNTIEFQNPIEIAGTNRGITVPDGGAVVDAIVSGAITNLGPATNFQKSGDGTLMLTGVNSWGSELRINAGKVMLGGSSGTVIGDTSNVQLGAGGTGSAVTFDLNGKSETIAALNLGGQNTTTPPGIGGNQHTVINSGAAAVLTINGLTYYAAADPLAFQNGQAEVSADINTGTGNKNFSINDSVYDDGSGPLAEEVLLSGALTGTSITKLLTGTLVLTNPQNSGNTTVSLGTLIVRKIGIQTNANPNNDAASISVATGAVLNLDYTGTDTVASLVMGANPPKSPGEYNSINSPGFITGTGSITVRDPFLIWAGNNPAVLFDGDENNDGVKNGLAWLLGAANPGTNANGLLPVVTQTGGSLKMTFDMLPALARAGSQLLLEHSGDLGITDLWSTGVLVPDATGGAVPVTFIVTDSNLADPTNKLDVEASVSSTEAIAGKLFGRLQAVK